MTYFPDYSVRNVQDAQRRAGVRPTGGLPANYKKTEQEARRRAELYKSEGIRKGAPTKVSEVDIKKGGPAALIKATAQDLYATERLNNPDSRYTSAEQVEEMIKPGNYSAVNVQRRQSEAGVGVSDDAGDANDGGGKLPGPTPTPAPTEDGGGGTGGSETRTSVTGLNQYGKTLGGLNQFTKAFTGGYEVEDISKAFKSEALPTTDAGKSQGHEGPRVNYSWDTESETDVFDETKGGLVPPSTAGTTGNNPDNPQDGTSAKPSVADKVRAIRVGRQSVFDDDDDSLMPSPGGDSDYEYPDDDSLVSPMYANERRNKIRSTFLNFDGPSVKAIAAANAVAGYGKDSDGNARFNVGGKLYGAKEGMEYKARNAAMSGENPMQYLDIPATPDTQPDSPADSAISMTTPIKNMNEEQQKQAAQEFAKGFVSDISEKLKNK